MSADRTRPLYRCPQVSPWPADRTLAGKHWFIDLSTVHQPPYGATVAGCAKDFDLRAAAVVSSAAALEDGLNDADLLKQEFAGTDAEIHVPSARCLAVLAHGEFFPGQADGLNERVSSALLAANPGWCGTYGPGVDGTLDLINPFDEFANGDYDMSQMDLLKIAYRYHEVLTEPAREHLVKVLLATGRIRRPSMEDIVTSGGAPADWSRGGFMEVPLPVLGSLLGVDVKMKRIGETENHILMIHTARYLTNQLLYQRDQDDAHDNRRNGSDDAPTCMNLMLMLLRNILRDDFSEYNAKSYQNESRAALLNLCSYAYDHEVRLAARMALDYVSAHMAVSSNDLRRLVPFRRLNDDKNSAQVDGFLHLGLLETTFGADPMAAHFAVLAGNTRAYQAPRPGVRPQAWSIKSDGTDGHEGLNDALSDYRLPPSVHDLFVTDLHRRFFQRLHRMPLDDEEVTGRNCDNHEIFAGSPSYLISAGGAPATYAIDPRFLGMVLTNQDQQLGVAVTTTFMPTGCSADNRDGKAPDESAQTGVDTRTLIQLGSFSDEPGAAINYGVAPDFACGHRVRLPGWCLHGNVAARRGRFEFIDKGGPPDRPGFYLALLRDGDFTAIEAFDTWLHPALKFPEFVDDVWRRNEALSHAGLRSNVEAEYTTHNGNRLRFVIWKSGDGEGVTFDGARVLGIDYGPGDPEDALGDAGQASDHFLRGTVLNSAEGGMVVISNPSLATTLTLDMRDPARPRRIDEAGTVEEAGSNQEVWVDFAWTGTQDGDFYHPFASIEAALDKVADGGVVRLKPGRSGRTPVIPGAKRVRLVAPAGGVEIAH